MGGVNCFEPALGWSGNTLKVSHKLISKQCLALRISERSDHEMIYTEYRYTSRRTSKIGCPGRSILAQWAAVLVDESDPKARLGLARQLLPICVLRSHGRSGSRSAMSSRCRFVAAIIVSSIRPATRLPGGTTKKSMHWKLPRDFGRRAA